MFQRGGPTTNQISYIHDSSSFSAKKFDDPHSNWPTGAVGPFSLTAVPALEAGAGSHEEQRYVWKLADLCEIRL